MKVKSAMFFQSLIDVDTWNEAKWLATAYFVSQDPQEPPVLGLLFQNEKPAIKIFKYLIERVDKNDPYDELRIAIIEGKIDNENGYSVHISSNPENTLKRSDVENLGLDAEQMVVLSRVHRMIPDPKSPHLANFKEAYKKHNRYLFIPVTGTPQSLKSHFNLAIGKSQIYFKNVDDVKRDENDRDRVVLI